VVVAPSRWLGDLAAQSHLGRFPVHVIPNGINLSVFSPLDQAAARNTLELPKESLLVCAVASTWDNPHKGGDLLFELAHQVSVERLGRLVVVGRMGTEMREQLVAHGAVVRDGWHGNDDLRAVFSACDGFLLLSRSENLPYVVSEALACGCPPIARDVGGVGEMFRDGVHGWLTPAASGAAGFLSGIRQLAARSLTERRGLRRAARTHTERVFPLSMMVREYEKLYEDLLLPQSGQRRWAA
jgi:glycosyltransferase involved in cell wall biosynthesis